MGPGGVKIKILLYWTPEISDIIGLEGQSKNVTGLEFKTHWREF